MFCWAVYAFTLWLKHPSIKSAAVFGVASGLSLCTKFSAVAFVPACGAAILVMYVVAGNPQWRGLFRTVGVGLLCAFMVTWAVYRFSHAPLNQFTMIPDRVAVKVFGANSGMTNAVRRVTSTMPAPMPEIPDGIRYLRDTFRAKTVSLTHLPQSVETTARNESKSPASTGSRLYTVVVLDADLQCRRSDARSCATSGGP